MTSRLVEKRHTKIKPIFLKLSYLTIFNVEGCILSFFRMFAA